MYKDKNTVISEDGDTTILTIKLISALITLESSVDSALDVLRKSYGVNTPHIKEGIRRLEEGIKKCNSFIKAKESK